MTTPPAARLAPSGQGAISGWREARHRIRDCDAVYVALAADLGEPLVTFDRQQRERVLDAVTVVTPGQGS